MKRLVRYIFASAFACTVLFTGCKRAEPDSSDVVGVLLRNDTEVFLKDYKEALEKTAKEKDIKIKVYSANSDAAIQIDQVKTMLLNGVRHFVIIPYSTDLTEQMAKMIYSQGGSAAFSNINTFPYGLQIEAQNFLKLLSRCSCQKI